MRVVVMVAALSAAGCGSDPVCGDGRAEGDEMCDDGNTRDDDACSNTCRVQPTLDATIVWTIAAQEAPGFSETCGGVGANEIDLAFTGPTSFTATVDCNFGQTPFAALAAGAYTVRATLYDVVGEERVALTNGDASAQFTITNADVTATIDIPFADFIVAKTGTYFFRIKWGGAGTCTGATPPVAKHVLRLERDGTPLPGLTDEGDPIDGSAPGVCRPFTEQFPQAVNGLAWGPATMTITGLDASDTPQFMETFDTFVGAGPANPDAVLDVNSLAPDAGPPDAALPDAALPDAAGPDAMP
jgi:cysteine-rich repeat protein